MYIYLAHQMSGLSVKAIQDYYVETKKILQDFGYKTLCPISGKTELKIEDECKPYGYTNPIITDHAITTRDKWMVRKADVVYVNLLGTTKVSIGCVGEIIVAKENNKHVIVVMEKDNLHHHAFIHASSDIIFEDENEALEYLKELVGGV